MTSTERAKAFLRRKLKQTALIILPLAAAAVSAHASVTFSVTNGNMQSSGVSATTASGSTFTASPINNGFNGLSIFGSATYIANTSGLGNQGVAECGSICGGFFADGTVDGTFDTDSTFVTFLFTPTASNGDSIDWDLLVNIGDASNSASGTVASGVTVNSNFLLTGLTANSLPTGWSAQLTVDFHDAFAGGDSISLSIPSDSTVDIGVQNPAPEPASLLLIGPALGGLFLFRRRLQR